jgi:hypothetical protein
MSERGKILEEIHVERRAQDKQWGGANHDADNSLSDWRSYILKQLRLVETNATPQEYRPRLVKIAALAIAALEALP